MTQTPEEFRRRVDADLKRAASAVVGNTPLSKKKAEKPLEPLKPVDLTPPPGAPYYWPFETEKEYLAARDEDTERAAGEIESKSLREGKVPWASMVWRITQGNGWWKLLLGGVGAAAIVKLVGC